MKEFHPSVSAIGNHLDAQFDTTATLPQQSQEESLTGNWIRRHLPSLASETPPSDADLRTEEAMHLDQ
jgi:hypothetical protein